MKVLSNSAELLETCRQFKAADDRMACPKCDSVAVVRNGCKSGRQRYLCKNCRTSVGDTHGSFFHSRLSADTWGNLISLVLRHRSVRELARDLHIHRNTALFNIHRICVRMKQYANVDGGCTSTAETDKWYYPLSFSGMRIRSSSFMGLEECPAATASKAGNQVLKEAGVEGSILDGIDENEDAPSGQHSRGPCGPARVNRYPPACLT